jgi:hypothetical protein
MNPNIHEAFDRLKEQGKLRFLASLAYPHLETVMSRGGFAIRCHHGRIQFPELAGLANIFRDAKQKV